MSDSNKIYESNQINEAWDRSWKIGRSGYVEIIKTEFAEGSDNNKSFYNPESEKFQESVWEQATSFLAPFAEDLLDVSKKSGNPEEANIKEEDLMNLLVSTRAKLAEMRYEPRELQLTPAAANAAHRIRMESFDTFVEEVGGKEMLQDLYERSVVTEKEMESVQIAVWQWAGYHRVRYTSLSAEEKEPQFGLRRDYDYEGPEDEEFATFLRIDPKTNPFLKAVEKKFGEVTPNETYDSVYSVIAHVMGHCVGQPTVFTAITMKGINRNEAIEYLAEEREKYTFGSVQPENDQYQHMSAFMCVEMFDKYTGTLLGPKGLEAVKEKQRRNGLEGESQGGGIAV